MTPNLTQLLSDLGTITGSKDGGTTPTRWDPSSYWPSQTTARQRAIGPLINALGNIGGAYLQTRGTQKGLDERNRIALMAENRLKQAADTQRAIDLFDIQRNQDLFSGLTRPQLQFQRAAHDKYASKSGYDLAATEDLFPERELPDILKDPNAPLFDKEGHRYHRPQLGESTAANRLDPALWPNQGEREDRGWGKGLGDLFKYGGYGLLAASALSGLGVPKLGWAPKALGWLGRGGGLFGGQDQNPCGQGFTLVNGRCVSNIDVNNDPGFEALTAAQNQLAPYFRDFGDQATQQEVAGLYLHSDYAKTQEGFRRFYNDVWAVFSADPASGSEIGDPDAYPMR